MAVEMNTGSMSRKCEFSNEEISRYSRQLILPEIGVEGQAKLKNGKVLIVGMGGLGCPCAMYLAAAGVTTLGLLDYDSVEVNNLHRQILHTENTIGFSKTKSASEHLKRINSRINCIEHHQRLDSDTALAIIKTYDIVVDASDNVPTRYLVNDACVLAGKPLVSGSALRFEGQLTVYNYKDGPCYRCLYPKPPPPETITNCSDGGVIGAVTGLIGSLQALEVIKILAGLQASYCRRLLMFDGMTGDIRTIKLRAKKDNCPICSVNPTITKLVDYEIFCGSCATDKTSSLHLLKSSERISVKDYKNVIDEGRQHILIDVRPSNEFKICSLKNAINFPINEFESGHIFDYVENMTKNGDSEVFVVCKQGNDSQKAVSILKKKLRDPSAKNDILLSITDIVGGLAAWSAQIDKSFPTY